MEQQLNVDRLMSDAIFSRTTTHQHLHNWHALPKLMPRGKSRPRGQPKFDFAPTSTEAGTEYCAAWSSIQVQLGSPTGKWFLASHGSEPNPVGGHGGHRHWRRLGCVKRCYYGALEDVVIGHDAIRRGRFDVVQRLKMVTAKKIEVPT